MFRYAFRNLLRSPLRSLFTLVSIITIMALYVLLQSVTSTFEQELERLFSHDGVEIIVQSRYAATPVTSSIKAEIVDRLRSDERIAALEPLIVGRKRVANRASLFIFGIDDLARVQSRLGMHLRDGHLFHQPNEELVGEKTAQKLGLKLGDMLTLGEGEHMRIAGLFGSWLQFLDAAVVLPLAEAQRVLGKSAEVSLLLLRLHQNEEASEVMEAINRDFPELTAVDALSLPDQFGAIKTLYRFGEIVAILTLIMSFAVMFNTFLLSGLERTREAGILSAIGWSRGRIVMLMVLEAAMLCIGGAVGGFLLAFPLLMLLEQSFGEVYMYLPDAPSLFLLWHALGMAVVIALLSALYPALYATRLAVAEALRYES